MTLFSSKNVTVVLPFSLPRGNTTNNLKEKNVSPTPQFHDLGDVKPFDTNKGYPTPGTLLVAISVTCNVSVTRPVALSPLLHHNDNS